jgi:hypothetical protein
MASETNDASAHLKIFRERCDACVSEVEIAAHPESGRERGDAGARKTELVANLEVFGE